MIDKKTLHEIRNLIPIDEVIKTLLNMQFRYREGHLRFLCPDCTDLHTSVNLKTNLARCFICQKNYNPIDLYMKINRTNFRKTVDILLRLLPYYKSRKN
jgi:DNA primase